MFSAFLHASCDGSAHDDADDACGDPFSFDLPVHADGPQPLPVFGASPLRSPLPGCGSSSGSLGSLSPLFSSSPSARKRVREETATPTMPTTASPSMAPSAAAPTAKITVKRPNNFEAFLRANADKVAAHVAAVSSPSAAAATTSVAQPAPLPHAPSLLSLATTVLETEEKRPSFLPCGEIYVTDWIPQGDNMKGAIAGDAVALRVVRRPNFKPAVQVMKRDANYTFCWLQPTQCAMVIPLLEGGAARIEGQWMRAGSASGVRLALLLRVSLVASQLDPSKRVLAKTSAEIAAWTSLATLLRTSPAVILANAGVSKTSRNSTSDLLDLTTDTDELRKDDDGDEDGPKLEKLYELRVDVFPMEPSPDVAVPLHQYQKEGLGWMAQREAESGPGAALADKRLKTSEDVLPPGWEARKDPASGKTFFVNLKTGVQYSVHPGTRAGSVAAASSRTEPVGACGGILADDMGLGKTVMMLSLMATLRAAEGTAKGTLIVCPLSVITQWEKELATRTRPGTFSVLLHHGPSRPQNAEELRHYDVVLTTYATLAQEFDEGDGGGSDGSAGGGKKRARPQRVLLDVDWFRVVLDEAHTIKDRQTRTAKACFELRGQRRWALTGTPIQNKLEDVFSLLQFIRVSPYGSFTWFQQHVLRPIKGKDARGFDRLKQILSTVLLRRTKTQTNDVGSKLINLPARTVNIVRLPFTPDEQSLYATLYDAARNKVAALISSSALLDNYAHVLLMLLRLRQVCDHPLMAKLSLATGNSGGRDCVLSECQQCFAQTAALRTNCRHEFCQGCVESVLTRTRMCPVCSASVSAMQCTPIAAADALLEDDTSTSEARLLESEFFMSTKLRALVEALTRVRNEDTTVKSIVFSQFTSMLDLVAIALAKHNIPFARLDGSMSQSSRVKEIERFRSDANVSVFLISLKAGGQGLNLTCANHVYILDPWWNPSQESQAIDRVHRIGQTRNVLVTRFVIADSIEEAMLRLQDSKTEMAVSALGRATGGGKGEHARITELKTIFGLK